ncbi:MAG: hypothetical protein U0271_34010 [Polyangiaceae bacterium]
MVLLRRSLGGWAVLGLFCTACGSDPPSNPGGAPATGGAGGAGGGASTDGGGGASISSGGSGPSDVTPPIALVNSPEDPFTTSDSTVTIIGSASDESGVASVLVNGVLATTSDGFKTFSADVPLLSGKNVIEVETQDVLGNEDPDAASVTVHRLDGAGPQIVNVFPPSYAAFEGPTLPVRVRVADLADVVSVNVGGVEATLGADGYWLALDVPAEPNTIIEVIDAQGEQAVETRSFIPRGPLIGRLSLLTEGPAGTVIGYDDTRKSLVKYDPFASPQYAELSSPQIGSGPALLDTPNVIDWQGDSIFLASFNGLDTPQFTIMQVDVATGDRTVLPECSLPELGPMEGLAVITGSPFRVFVFGMDGTYECSDQPTTQLGGPLPQYAHAAKWDDVHQRVVFAVGPTVHAFDPANGAVTTITTIPTSATALAVLDGEIYGFLSDGNLVHIPETGPVEDLAFVETAIHSAGSLAACSDGSVDALCFNNPWGMTRYARDVEAWSDVTPTDVLAVGSGPRFVGSATNLMPLSRSLTPDVVFGTEPVRTNGSTGVRTRLGSLTMSEPIMLENGLAVDWPSAIDATPFSVFDLHAASPVAATIPGDMPPDTPGVHDFEIVPANTWFPHEAIVYETHESAGQDTLYVRDVVTGDEVLALSSASANNLFLAAADEDGVLYLKTATNFLTLSPGDTDPQPFTPGELTHVHGYDFRSRSLRGNRNSELASFNLDTLETRSYDLSNWRFMSTVPPKFGPFTGSLYVIDSRLLLVDTVANKMFVLSR